MLMRKIFRLNYLLIALAFVLMSGIGIVIFNTQAYNLTFICFEEGRGTAEDPYLIRTSEQVTNLQILSSSNQYNSLRNKNFLLMNDIVVNSTGKELFGFCGTFDGNNHTLTLRNGILFYNLLSGGVVKNINLKTGLSSLGKPSTPWIEYCGLIRNVNKGARVENITATGNINIDFSNTKPYYAGKTLEYLICGLFINVDGVVSNCSYTGDIKRIDKFPRLFEIYLNGFNYSGNGIIQNCTYNGNITSYGALRSVCGIFSASTIESCTYNGNYFSSCEVLKTTNNNAEKRALDTYLRSGIVYSRVFKGLSSNCIFNGDFTFDYNNIKIKNAEFEIVNENSVNFTHNGNVYEINKR